MMIKDCNQLIRYKPMDMEWAKILYGRKKQTERITKRERN